MKKYIVYSEKKLTNGKYGKEKRLGGFKTYTEAVYFLEELRAYEKDEIEAGHIRFFQRYEQIK